MPPDKTYMLQDRLDAYMQQARVNEQKLRQFQDMELKLLAADSFVELCVVLVSDYCSAFKLDRVTLTLIDSSQKLHSLLQAYDAVPEHIKDSVMLVTDYEDLQRLNAQSKKPELSRYDVILHERFFKPDNVQLGSAAILPMHRHNLLFGFLSLGSVDPNRYTSDMATDFLERLAAMAAVSLENAVNLEYLKQLGLMDTLTSANNRRYFFRRLEQEISKAQRQSHTVGCLYLDLDHFKQINDRYGHAAGDMVLVHLVNLIRGMIRNSDVLARLGGEEFAVILPEISPLLLQEIAERIRIMVAGNPCELTTDASISVTVSVGMALFNLEHIVGEPAQLGEALVDQADQALYRAKQTGRNKVCAFEDL